MDELIKAFDFDGETLLCAMLEANICKDPVMAATLRVLKKHGHNMLDALAICLELSAALNMIDKETDANE